MRSMEDHGSTTRDGFRVLVFSRTTRHRHDSIAAGVEAVRVLGARHGFEVRATEDPGAFRDDHLARYAAVVWLQPSGPVLDAAGRAAYERFTRRGGGFVGVHAAATAEPDWPFYGSLLGARFLGHPPGTSPAVIEVADSGDPSTAGLPRPWRWTDEWYTFQSDPGDPTEQ